MKIIKVTPVCHNDAVANKILETYLPTFKRSFRLKGSGIFSIDIQPPSDRRLATGGRADTGAGLVAIWDFKKFTEQESNGDELLLLCRLENHTGCVNCVRWSGNGRYLASAGDDTLITIMQFAGRLASSAENGQPSNGMRTNQNVEVWKCMHTLRGHAGDVLHIAWSPDDIYLASCSVDNQIIIWNGHRLGEKVATLSGHKGLVKGITWDPVGKYLASQSDDRSLRIWSTVNWKMKKIIETPFQECDPTTQFLRLDWSPDGALIATAHAMNNGGPVSKLVEREGWETERDYVGHRKAVTCVRWSPCIYEVTNSNKTTQSCVCAVGSKDRAVSFWSTEFQRPLTVFHEGFTQTVMDFSWSQLGRSLVACSTDGSILHFTFSENDLGRPLSQLEKNGTLQRLYGTANVLSLTNGYSNGYRTHSGVANGAFVVDNPEILKIQQELQQLQKPAVPPPQILDGNLTKSSQSSISSSQGPSNGLVCNRPQQQIESRTKDGKKRIQPIFLGTTVVAECSEDAALPTVSSISASTATDAVPAQGTVTSEAERNSRETTERPEAATARPHDEAQASTSNAMSGSAITSTPASHTASTTSFKGVEIKRKTGLPPTSHQSKKPRQQQQSHQKRNRRTILSDDEDEAISLREEKTQNADKEMEELVQDVERGALSMTAQTIILPVPTKQDVLSVSIKDTHFKIMCENGVQLRASGHPVSKLVAFEREKLLWRSMLSSEVLAIAASVYVIAAVGNDRRFHLFKMDCGSRLMPPIALDSDISILSVQQYYVMAVTSQGNVHVWDFNGSFTCLCKESLLPIISNSNTSISRGFITNYGAPVLTLSDGKSYVYSSPMQSWINVYKPEDANAASAFTRISSMVSESWKIDGPLATCLHSGPSTVALTPKRDRLVHASDQNDRANDLLNLSVASFLESQIHSALELRSAQEYRFWLIQYAQELTRAGMVNKLRQLCQDLMDKVFQCGMPDKKSDADILGIPKNDLLREVLSIMAKNAELQRLYGEIKEQMKINDKAMIAMSKESHDRTGDSDMI